MTSKPRSTLGGMRTRSLCGPIALTLAMTLNASPSAAQPSRPEERARATLLAESVTARSSGDHARALDLAQRAGAIRMTPSLRQFVAEELQALGRLPEALAAARTCVRDAEIDVTARQREGVLTDCRALVAALEPPEAAPPPTPVAPAAAPAVVPAPATLPPPVAPRSAAPSAAQWVVGGVGVAMLGGALATFLMEASARDEQRSHCTENEATLLRSCADARGVELGDRRDALRGANYVLFFGGLAAVGGAAAWYLVDRLTAPSRGPTTWNLHVSPSATGLSVAVGGSL